MDKGQQDERQEQLRELMADAMEVHAQLINRITDALRVLERIAKAMEAGARAGEPQPATAPQEPAAQDNPVDPWRGWRPTGGSDALQSEPEAQGASEGAQGVQECPTAAPGGEPERPSLRHGCICDRLPTKDDADEDGCVRVWKNGRYGWIWYHHVVPGQPWQPCT